MPAISWPGTIGKIAAPHSSRAWWMSEWQMPAYAMSISDVVRAEVAALDGAALEGLAGGGGEQGVDSRRHGGSSGVEGCGAAGPGDLHRAAVRRTYEKHRAQTCGGYT